MEEFMGNDNMRVMYVLNTSSFSGAENVIITIIKNLPPEVEAYYVSLDGRIREKLFEEKIKFYPLPKVNAHNLKKAIKEVEPDIIHANDTVASVTVTFNSEYKAVKVYQNGEEKIVFLNNGVLTLDVASAEGVFLIPVKAK